MVSCGSIEELVGIWLRGCNGHMCLKIIGLFSLISKTKIMIALQCIMSKFITNLTDKLGTIKWRWLKSIVIREKASLDIWHYYLSHPSLCIVKHILFSNKLLVSSNKTFVLCNSCQQIESHNLSFYLSPFFLNHL